MTAEASPDPLAGALGPDAPTASAPGDGSPVPAHAEVEVIEAAPVNHEEYERLLAERDEFLNALQLVKADFDNYRKRVERDRAAERQAAGRDILVEILPVMDNLDRALAALGDVDNGVRAGIEMVRGQLAGTLAARGITEIEAHERMEFDPNVHEAVVQSHSPGFPEGTLIAVVEKGYRHNDTVIRPAKVVVAAAAADG